MTVGFVPVTVTERDPTEPLHVRVVVADADEINEIGVGDTEQLTVVSAE